MFLNTFMQTAASAQLWQIWHWGNCAPTTNNLWSSIPTSSWSRQHRSP